MAGDLSPAKAILLAVHLAAIADIDNLRYHAAKYTSVLRKDFLLRIILTHLPETVAPDAYTALLQEISDGTLKSANNATEGQDPTHSSIANLSEDEAIAKLKRLHLLDLRHSLSPQKEDDDALVLFLYHRAVKLDQDAGLLHYVPGLLRPFLNDRAHLRTWFVSTVLPLHRRNYVYYPATDKPLALLDFQALPDIEAVDYLLAETAQYEGNLEHIGRDLRGILGPWLRDDARWQRDGPSLRAAGWDHFLQWLTTKASQSWRIPAEAFQQWSGLQDADCGDVEGISLDSAVSDSARTSYRRALLASAYSVSESSLPALKATYQTVSAIRAMVVSDETISDLDSALEALPTLVETQTKIDSPAPANFVRQGLLDARNPLTSPDDFATARLQTYCLGAFIISRLGLQYTARTAAELALHGDAAEQKSELVKIVRMASNNPSRDDDVFWTVVRRELLWLQSSHTGSSVENAPGQGILSSLKRETVELELIKAMLANSRYDLARSIYDHSESRPLADHSVQDAVLSSALNAFDNATNPNRTRGGLKKCDEISRAFPNTLPSTLTSSKRLQALLKATHGLASYKIVLKQGEPFSPVVLRIHADPISLFEKVLEQNPAAYTRIGEFVQMGRNLAIAGFIQSHSYGEKEEELAEEKASDVAEKRVVAMCIEAALREDDFETAYSYVISRLGIPIMAESQTSADDCSWRAALKAGQFVRSQNSLQPTHLGTSSGNLEIRHLEQRLECLATALRIAPAEQLLEILKTFRRCEEQLDSAIVEEAAQEEAWDAIGDVRNAPGSFEPPGPNRLAPARNMTASASVRQAEEAPMSLFDLSRATARIASKNLTSLPGLGRGETTTDTTPDVPDEMDHSRVRKRDQFREAATGTLVSGVGWLIGANINRSGTDEAN